MIMRAAVSKPLRTVSLGLVLGATTWLSNINSVLAGEFNHQAFDTLLATHVKPIKGSTQVDYQGLQSQRNKLTDYLRRLSAVEQSTFEQWPYPEQLAFLINAYNGFTLELILNEQQKRAKKGDELESIKDIGSFFSSPWKQSFFTLLGETQTLDGIEHGLIRGAIDYSEPRIHFAVNCASVGCPALRNGAYTAEALDQQLDEQTRAFLSDASRNRFDADKNRLAISSIFKWYRDDFDRAWAARGTLAASNSLGGFLYGYRNELNLTDAQSQALKAGDVDISFLPYDWALNQTSHKTKAAGNSR
ncbi:MAG: DUF547 domain-containing protein [Pontibacterium sp.]